MEKGAGVAGEAGEAGAAKTGGAVCCILILDVGFQCSISEAVGKQKKRGTKW